MSSNSTLSNPAATRIDSESLFVPSQHSGGIELSSGLRSASSFSKKPQRPIHFITSGAVEEIKSSSGGRIHAAKDNTPTDGASSTPLVEFAALLFLALELVRDDLSHDLSLYRVCTEVGHLTPQKHRG
jgi:hypothetical protein